MRLGIMNISRGFMDFIVVVAVLGAKSNQVSASPVLHQRIPGTNEVSKYFGEGPILDIEPAVVYRRMGKQ
jgi:hypothetical protein